MSFYIVPSMSYQTQQKMKKKDKDGEKGKKRKKRSSLETHDEVKSLQSTSSGSSSSIPRNSTSERGSNSEVTIANDESVKLNERDAIASPLDSSRQNSASSKASLVEPHTFTQRQHLGGSTSSAATKLSGGRQKSTSEASTLSGTRFSRKLSTTFMNAIEQYSPSSTTRSSVVSSNSQLPLVTNSPKSKQEALFKSSYIDGKFNASSSSLVSNTKLAPDNRSTNSLAREFVPIINIEQLNTFDGVRKCLYNPQYQVHRYELFINSVKEYHVSDAINFGNVRNYSLIRFISRLSKTSKNQDKEPSQPSEAIYEMESYFSLHAFRLRYMIRREMRKLLKEISHAGEIIAHEELMQINFTNYIRYILELPDISTVAPENLTDELRGHYTNKDTFVEVRDKLYVLSKEEVGEGGGSSFNSTDHFLQMIAKVSNDYFLLEKYFLQILFKLDGNHPLDPKCLQRMFDLYCQNKKDVATGSSKFKLVKVLNYNTFFSAVESWYIAVLCPFLDVYESSCYAEDPDLIKDSDKYYENHRMYHEYNKSRFNSPEEDIYQGYFKHVPDFKNDFNYFKGYSPEKLVKLQEKIHEFNKRENNLSAFKPMNFQYYNKSLSTIPDETFDFVQCRDLALQLTPSNYKVTLREFHRILKKGGSLEIPGIQLGGDSLKSFLNTKRDDFFKKWEMDGLNINSFFDIIPNFTEEVLRELNTVFGKCNVKYGYALLNTDVDVNMYLVQYVLWRTFEIDGKLEIYNENIGEEGRHHGRGIHFFVKIVAQKE